LQTLFTADEKIRIYNRSFKHVTFLKQSEHLKQTYVFRSETQTNLEQTCELVNFWMETNVQQKVAAVL